MQAFLSVSCYTGCRLTDSHCRTRSQTGAATDTSAGGKEFFLESPLTFGIVAPPAGQRASLEKNSGTDSGTIMNGKFFDVKDDSVFHAFYDI